MRVQGAWSPLEHIYARSGLYSPVPVVRAKPLVTAGGVSSLTRPRGAEGAAPAGRRDGLPGAGGPRQHRSRPEPRLNRP
ncbi:hypothetical protein GCM10010393_17660 [Streptomyces gobitricini]|uniref:Uncharacterized protein n=1 Tax=Streptomyces gobitricini TaxID=68211 RepID=A0ABN3LMM9_9ACTN